MPQPPVALQPLAQQARRLQTTLAYLGQPLARLDQQLIDDALAVNEEEEGVRQIQTALDKYALAVVRINPESRVSVEQGPAAPELVEGGTRVFLVKVLNEAGVTAPLRVESPNSGDVFLRSNGSPEPARTLTTRDVRERWATFSLYNRQPAPPRLSGLAVEYVILEIFSRDSGHRSAQIAFNVGQGTQDVGYRNDVAILFTAVPARLLPLRVRDERGNPAVASLLVRDRFGRIYPNQSKRLAPDFPFQPQVYRSDGEVLRLPDGTYTVTTSGGPEYVTQTKELRVDAGGPRELAIALERWIDPPRLGWFSGDHHIHAAGCSHYQNPTEGVLPEDMMRQILGESLNIGSVLTWGPCYYYQKQFFSGEDNPLSKTDRRMHYDLEVSGFPSSHAGHLVLLGLKDQDYPKTHRIEDWPSWDLPILKWGKSQGAVVGFAHSGWGLQVQDRDVPSFEMPAFDGIGANEFIVDVTHPNSVDFISTIDTPSVAELSIWYHTLNVGFRTRIAGETDFPCIYDGRVGIGRTYARIDGALTYPAWLDGLRTGRSYVSDGKSHLLDFTVDGVLSGRGGSEVKLSAARTVAVRLRVAAYLDPLPSESIRSRPLDRPPYWDIERARIGTTREVPVELIVNGAVAATRHVPADGQLRDVAFDVAIDTSSWIAARVLPSSHTNPVFAIVGEKPIRASRRSAEWCLAAVNQCWTQKAPAIRPSEQRDARAAYEHAREVYKRLIAESSDR
ncbi:MAG TPA: CehA/McbA family metallohydrolase [Vicinamibacterales bacterium]|nr:CehA/McbA family metallohydrolase [Vicinamibacterales bacterium]